MKRLALSLICGSALTALAITGTVRGQTPPPPPPPPNGGTPLPTIAPPCPPVGCATATPTATVPPTATATATATATSIPLFETIRLSKKSVRAGQVQTVHVTTLPGAHVVIHVTFPHARAKHHGGHADSAGDFTWKFKEPANAATSKSKKAHVVVRVDNGAGTLVTGGKAYTIA